jgi:hypothetical protein
MVALDESSKGFFGQYFERTWAREMWNGDCHPSVVEASGRKEDRIEVGKPLNSSSKAHLHQPYAAIPLTSFQSFRVLLHIHSMGGQKQRPMTLYLPTIDLRQPVPQLHPVLLDFVHFPTKPNHSIIEITGLGMSPPSLCSLQSRCFVMLSRSACIGTPSKVPSGNDLPTPGSPRWIAMKSQSRSKIGAPEEPLSVWRLCAI